MAKYHIGENGPARCRAFVRTCPIGGEHFEDEYSAQKEYERVLRVQHNELQAHKREVKSVAAAEEVKKRIAGVEGTMLDQVYVHDLQEGDVLLDGRVVRVVEDERWMSIRGREDAGIGVYFMSEYDEFPPGFSYDHFPPNGDNIDDVSAFTKYANVFRPAVPKRVRISSPGNEIRDGVVVEDLLPGDELPDGRVVAEVENARDVGLQSVTLYFEWEDGKSVGSQEFPIDRTFDNVFLDKPR